MRRHPILGATRWKTPALAEMGARIAITGRGCARVVDAVGEIRAAGGGSVDVFVADLSSQAQIRRVAAEALDRLDQIDVLMPRLHRIRARILIRRTA